MTQPPDPLLLQLAEAAGLMASWRDAHGHERWVGFDTLRRVLDALELPCESEAQCRDSLKGLGDEGVGLSSPGLLRVRQGAPVIVRRAGSPHYRLELEDGTRLMGTAQDLDGNRVAIPAVRRPGYHRLRMGRIDTTIAVVPPRCHPVATLTGQAHAWVAGAQVYSLRQGGGHLHREPAAAGRRVLPGWETGGSFGALGELARGLAAHGAAGLAISPVHALFSADASRYSPYAPSSRLFLNALYADPAAVFDPDMLRPLQQASDAPGLTADGCIEWPAIHTHRLRQLRRLFDIFNTARPSGLEEDFNTFLHAGGDALERHVRYEALHAHHATALGPAHGWQDWPAEYREPDGAAVRRFAGEHGPELRFHAFLQWLAARSLAVAHQGAREAGMPLGLIADMAVGTDPRGSQAWSRPSQILSGVSIGAPPDIFQPGGQDWGLTAFSPRALRVRGYDGFIETLRAVLAHAGGVRVDHVLGLGRMWLVPEGAAATDGVYLKYPREALLDLLALEAWRHRAVAVGENLGTVPEDFNAAIAQRGILGMSVLWFEQGDDAQPVFRPRRAWPAQSMAMVSTHDLPTLRGWWCGRDLQWRQRLGQLGAGEFEAAWALRRTQRKALWAALQRDGLAPAATAVPEDAPVRAVLAYIAGTPAALCNVSLEDLTGQVEQPNLPASGDMPPPEGHPNWCRALDVTVEALLQDPAVVALMQRIDRSRREAAASPAGAQ